MKKTQKKFSKVYVLAKSAKHAHETAKKLDIPPNNFQYICNKNIKNCWAEGCFLTTDSFKDNKHFKHIKEVLDSYSKAIVLNEREYKEQVYINYKK